ncbi:MAG: M28 family peptidase [Desulfohalobiaceae bacterium]
MSLTDASRVKARLCEHIGFLVRVVGERSFRLPQNLERAGAYVGEVLRDSGLTVHREGYPCGKLETANWVARLEGNAPERRHFLLGAHYDTVTGCPGADDNASAVAVLLETARWLRDIPGLEDTVSFVAFALEEPPFFGTRSMGSRVHAERLRRGEERLDGMLCLEMVGYTCGVPGCQGYPPLVKPLLGSRARDVGDYIAIVGSTESAGLSREVTRAFRSNPDLPVLKLNIPFRGRLIPQVRQSDHSAFWDLGYSAVMITDTAYYRNPHYHRATDGMETLDFDFMARLVESLVRFFSGYGREEPKL